MTPCPNCGRPEMDQIIYLGLPGHLCPTEGCNTLLGAASYAPAVTFMNANGERDFHFLRYEGAYPKGLWLWTAETWRMRRATKRKQTSPALSPRSFRLSSQAAGRR